MTVSMIRRNGLNGVPALGGVFGGPLGRVFQELANEPLLALGTPGLMGERMPEMPLDIAETERAVIVRASVPGFAKERVSVEVEDNVLTISATEEVSREEKGGETGERVIRRERRVGSVARSIALPEGVVGENTTAELKDGVLTVTLAKVQAKPARKITIA